MSVAASFALTAEAMVAEHQYMDAVQLCASGVREFPQYAAGYIMLARAYEAMGKLHDAAVMRTAIRERFPWYVERQPVAAPAVAPTQQGHELLVSDTWIGEAFALAGDVGIDVEDDVVDVAVDVAQESEPEVREHASILRIIDTAHLVNDERIIRSASVRLIPGLEYTSLRFENLRSRGRRDIPFLSDPPPFRSFHTMRRTTRCA